MDAPSSLIAAFLAPLGARKRWLPTFVVLCAAVFVWTAVGLGPYSGLGTPPQFGDFEAQRHWMELTQHLPPAQWYFYDFDWWRLDYPPLTAYHSWLCGQVGRFVEPAWFALDKSRGIENAGIKAFMRASVLVSQLAVYVLPVWLWAAKAQRQSPNAQSAALDRTVAFAGLLMFPALTIIDHGHFQFNSVMLGLATASLLALTKRRFVVASVLFVLALFFKQMALYYAPVMFTAILGWCVGPAVEWRLQPLRLISVGVAVLGTSALLLLPFWNVEQLKQIATRVFPVFRGLWEDKVANLWCTVNYTVYKLKANLLPAQLQMMALVVTLGGMAPACVAAFVGKARVWPWALASCAFAFFLFSFQVHEKSVLLPLLPTLLAAVQHRRNANVQAMTLWISNVAYFSMWPLLRREELRLQYFTLIALANWLFAERGGILPACWINKLAVLGSYAGMLALLAAENSSVIPEPILIKYPDLLVVGNMALSFGSFAYFWLWQTWTMLTLTTLNID